MRVKTWLWAWLLSFSISFGVISALITAFDFSDSPLTTLGFFCLVLCCLCAWAFLTKHGHWVLLGFLGVILVSNFLTGGLWTSFQALAYRLSVPYDSGYGWGVLEVPIMAQYGDPLPAVRILALLPALSVCWTVCHQKRLFLCLPLALVPLYPCFVVTDTFPDLWCFVLVLTAALVLVLTQTMRRRGHKEGNRLTAIALIPALLLSMFLVRKVPQDGYWSKLSSLQVLSQYLPSLEKLTDGLRSAPGMPTNNRTDLSDMGPQNMTGQPVMQVRSNYDGCLYLRYQAFDTYTGTQWNASNLPENPDLWPAESDLKSLGTVYITTEQTFDGMFTPYYPRGGSYLQLQNGKLPNSQSLIQYKVSVGQLREEPYTIELPDLSPWLELPDSTRKAANKILEEHNLRTPEQIIQYVENSADYSLQTGQMPYGNWDFAIWFLENSETGYCVHFATAAAVLLRAAGYPARYVSGYIVETQRNKPKTVTQDLAHAWVEYIDPDVMPFWQIAEATPGFGPQEPEIEPTTEPSQSTQPSQEPTQTTQPSQEPTLPDNTRPSQAVTQPVTTPATVPSQPGENAVDLSWLWAGLRHLGLLAAAVLALWTQYTVRLRLRLKKQRTGPKNAQALARWQEIRRLGWLLKAAPPENLLDLAEKARFSQHILTKEELFALGQYLQQQRQAIQKQPFLKRFFLKLFWAI